jgi:hypothetical protein
MKKGIPLLIVLSLLAFKVTAQLYLEPITGYQLDINNKGFHQINSGVQLAFKKSKRYEFTLLVQKSWGLSKISGDSAFTANPSLPVYAAAQKKILPGSFSFSAGHRIVLAGTGGRDKFSLLINTGFTGQKIKISYQYDKSNYTILNPDQTQDRFSVFISGGIEYMRVLKAGRLFFQINISSEPAGKLIKSSSYQLYPSSFHWMAPVGINAGYSILLKK